MNNVFAVSKNKFIFLLLGLILCLIVVFQLFGLSNDYVAYLRFFNAPTHLSVIIEPTAVFFKWISFGNFYLFIFYFAFISISLKMYVIITESNYIYLSLFLYLFMFFLLQDYTQWRASSAIGISLLAIRDLADKKDKLFFLKLGLAICFHYSAIIMLVVYLSSRILPKMIIVILPFFGFILAFTNFDLINVIEFFIGNDSILYNILHAKSGHKEDVNIFGVLNFLFLFMFYLCSIKYKEFKDYDFELFNTFSIGVFIFYFLSLLNEPVVSIRLFEFLIPVLILLLPNVVTYFKNRFIMKCIMVVFALLFFTHLMLNVIEF